MGIRHEEVYIPNENRKQNKLKHKSTNALVVESLLSCFCLCFIFNTVRLYASLSGSVLTVHDIYERDLDSIVLLPQQPKGWKNTSWLTYTHPFYPKKRNRKSGNLGFSSAMRRTYIPDSNDGVVNLVHLVSTEKSTSIHFNTHSLLNVSCPKKLSS